MGVVDTLLPRIEEYCRANGMAESTFGRLAVNDGKLVSRLRAGGSITVNTLQRIEDALSAPRGASSADRVVGSRIRLRRRQVGVSRARLAAMAGVPQQRIIEFENGAVRVGAERLSAIAQALEAPISFFFGELSAGEAGRPDAVPEPLAAPAAAELLSAYARIGNFRLRRAVLAVARNLAGQASVSECRSPVRSPAMRPDSSRPRGH